MEVNNVVQRSASLGGKDISKGIGSKAIGRTFAFSPPPHWTGANCFTCGQLATRMAVSTRKLLQKINKKHEHV